MARSDQFVGLNERAEKLVESKQKHVGIKTIIIEKFDGESKTIKENIFEPEIETTVSNKYQLYGMFDHSYPLNVYTFPDGKKLYEKHQTTIWSSGPVMFTALVDENDNWIEETLWTEDEINKII